MYHLHVTRPSVLEVGESSQLVLRTVDAEGRCYPVNRPGWHVVSSDPAVIEVNGWTLTGRKSGTAEVHISWDGKPEAEMVLSGVQEGEQISSGTVSSSQPVESVELCSAEEADSFGEAWTRTWTMEVVSPFQSSCPEMITDRPRILFTGEELSQFKERIQSEAESAYGFAAVWESALQQAEGYVVEQQVLVNYPSVSDVMEVRLPLTEPAIIPNPAGYVDYPYWTMFSRAIETRLCALSEAYLVTGEDRFAEKAKMYLLGLSDFGKWYEFDHRGAEGNLSNAHFVIGVASAFDAICCTLTEQERTKIAGALLYLGLQPLAIEIGNSDMHNIIAAKQVAMLYGAAALHGETPFAAKYMDQAYRYILSFLDRKRQGHETEGLLYDHVAARHMWMAADLYRRVTGDSSLCDHPYLREELPERFFRFLAPGSENTFPNFSDSFLKLDVSYMMAMLASRHLHPVAMWYIRQYEAGKPSVLMNLRRVPEAVHPDAYYGEKPSKVFPAIGWASLRTGWGERDHLLGFTSSRSDQGHNHRDQNNLMLNAGGEWLLTNPGYQDYVPGPRADYTTGTVGHNSLLVNGQGQPNYGGGALTDAWLAPGFEAVRGDATGSYGSLLDHFSRSVLHIENAYYLVWDEAGMNDAKDRPELLFHTLAELYEGSTRLTPGDVVRGNEVLLKGKQATLQMKWLHPEEADIRVMEYPGAESYGPYLSITHEKQENDHAFVTLLRPGTAGEPVRLLDHSRISGDGAIGFTLGREGRNDIFLLNGTRKSGHGLETSYAKCLLQGRAAWLSYQNEEQAANGPRPVKAAAWQATALQADSAFAIHSDQPVNLLLDWIANKVMVWNETAGDVQLTIKLTGRESAEWTLPPGEHSLTLPTERKGGKNR